MKKKIIIFLVLILPAIILSAATGSIKFGNMQDGALGSSFINSRGIGAKAIALGGAFTALANNPDAIYYNPAGLCQLKRMQVTFMFSQHMMSETISAWLGYVQPINARFTLSTGINFMLVPNISKFSQKGVYLGSLSQADLMIIMPFTAKVSRDISIAASVKLHYQQIGYDAGIHFLLDTSFIYMANFLKGLNFAIAIKDIDPIGMRINGTEEKSHIIRAPLLIKPGIAYTLKLGRAAKFGQLLMSGEIEFSLSPGLPVSSWRRPKPRFGLEYRAPKYIAIRGGMGNGEFTVGVGAFFSEFVDVDFSLNIKNFYSFKQSTIGTGTHISYYVSAVVQFGRVFRNPAEELVNKAFDHAFALYTKGQVEKAIEEWQQILQMAPDHAPSQHYYKKAKAEWEQYKTKRSKELKEADQHYKRGLDFFQTKDFVEAVIELKECIALDPQNREAANYLKEAMEQVELQQKKRKFKNFMEEAKQYEKNNELTKALIAYQSALDIEPENNKLADKIQSLRESIKIDIKGSKELYNIAVSFKADNRLKEALEKIEESLVKDPDNQDAAKLKVEIEDLIKSQKEERRSQRGKEMQISLHLDQAEKYYENGFLEKAIMEWQNVLFLDPHNREALDKKSMAERKLIIIQKSRSEKQVDDYEIIGIFTLGEKKFDDGYTKEALKEWEKIIAMKPSLANHLLMVKNIKMEMQKLSDDENLKGSPVYRFMEKHYKYGVTLFKNKQFDKAGEEWARVLKILPQLKGEKNKNIDEVATQASAEDIMTRKAMMHYDNAERMLNLGHPELCMAECKRILIMYPQFTRVQQLLQKANSTMPKEDKAKQKSKITALIKEAEAAIKEKDYQKAISNYTLVLSLEPGNKEVLRAKEAALADKKKYEKEQAINESKKMAELYAKNKNWTQAIQYWKKVLEYDPEDPEIHKKIQAAEDAQEREKTQVNTRKQVALLYNKGIEKYREAMEQYQNEQYTPAIQRFKEAILNWEEILNIDQFNRQAEGQIERAKSMISQINAKIDQKKKQIAEIKASPAEKAELEKKKEKEVMDKKLAWKHYLQGISHYTNGNLKLAIQEWEIVLKLDPANDKARENLKKAKLKLKNQ